MPQDYSSYWLHLEVQWPLYEDFVHEDTTYMRKCAYEDAMNLDYEMKHVRFEFRILLIKDAI